MTLSRKDVGAELNRAGIVKAALNGDGPPGWEATCPCCGAGGVIRWREGDSAWTCANGCDPSRIADEISMRASKMWNEPQTDSGARDPQSGGAFVPRAADPSRVRPFRWAWHGRVLIGYLNLLVGDEGVGKGTFLAWLTARLTRGDLPGDFHGRPARVLIVGDEDGFDNIWTPRLMAANADLSMVMDLPAGDLGDVVLERDYHELYGLILEHRIDVVIFDQLLDNLGVNVDDWKGKQVRHAIVPGRRLAADLEIVLLAGLHTNKNRSGKFRDRMSGSQQFNALSRSSLLLAEHPEDPERRVLVRGKGNYSKAAPAVEFSIASRTVDVNGYRIAIGGVSGLHESDLTLADVLNEPVKVLTKADHGRRLIAEALEDGEWHKASEILAALAEAGIADREARRLASDLGVDRRKSEGFPAHAEWRLARGGLPVYPSSRSSHSVESTPATPATPGHRRSDERFAGLGDGAAAGAEMQDRADEFERRYRGEVA